MLKRFKVISMFLALVLCTELKSAEGINENSSAISKKYNLSVCGLFKNEEKFLKEWIEYHRLVGVDHFYLYNIGSTDRSSEVLKPYIKEGVVSIIQWHNIRETDKNAKQWALAVQIPAYENAIKVKACNESNWLVFLDVNEFLVSPQANHLTQILEKYKDSPAVTLVNEFYDASKVELPKRKLLIQAVTLTKEPKMNKHKEVTKTIFKPELYKSSLVAPYQITFKNLQVAKNLRKQEMRINHYLNRNGNAIYYAKAKEVLHVDNRMISENETEELLAMDYEIEDQERAIHRFVPELLSKMGL